MFIHNAWLSEITIKHGSHVWDNAYASTYKHVG